MEEREERVPHAAQELRARGHRVHRPRDRRDEDLQLGDAAQGHRRRRRGRGLLPVQPHVREPVAASRGPDFRDIPLLANREVWLRKTVMDPDGQPELDEDGRAVKDTVKVMPAQLKEAVDAGRSRYLAERAEHARQASRAAEHEAPRAQRSVER